MPKDRKPGTLESTLDEIKSGAFVVNARRRSSRRKSRWNILLLLIFPLWLALGGYRWKLLGWRTLHFRMEVVLPLRG